MNKGKKLVVLMMCALLLAGCSSQQEVSGKGSEAEKSKVQVTDEKENGEGKDETGKVTAEATKDAEVFSMEKKYALYVPCDCGGETCKTWENGEGVEEELSLWYGTWFDEEGGSIEFTREAIGGRAYGVKKGETLVYEDGSWPSFELYYFDSPDAVQRLYVEQGWFNTADGEVTLSYLVLEDEQTYDRIGYCEADLETQMSLALQDEMIRQEMIAERENLIKEQVYNCAIADFEAYVNSRYSIADRVFMLIDYQPLDEATYHHDKDMNEYKIRFKVTLDENIFTLGMNKYTYVLRATYTEENGRLVKISFDLD